MLTSRAAETMAQTIFFIFIRIYPFQTSSLGFESVFILNVSWARLFNFFVKQLQHHLLQRIGIRIKLHKAILPRPDRYHPV